MSLALADRIAEAVASGRLLGPGEWMEIPRGAIHNATVVGDQPAVSLESVKL